MHCLFLFFQARSKYEILVTFRDFLIIPRAAADEFGARLFRDHRSLAGGAVDDARASSQAQSPRERALAHALSLRSASCVPAYTGPRARHMPCWQRAARMRVACARTRSMWRSTSLGPRATSALGVAYAQYVNLNAAALK